MQLLQWQHDILRYTNCWHPRSDNYCA